MALNNRKITTTDITTKGVVAAPDKLTGTASENKAVFDRLIREVIKDDFNGLIDDLNATTASTEIGTDVEGLESSNVAAALGELLDITETKADLVTDAVEGNFAAFDGNGNPVDSGHKHSDYLTQHQSLDAYRTSAAQDIIDNTKVDKVIGKGLSTNDYDNTEKGKVTANTGARHSHSNKDLLDTYDQTNSDITDAVDKKHNHSNKAIIDSITQALFNTWNTVIGKEDTTNKVTSISSLSTDEEYPSAKAVYNAIGAGGTVTSVNGHTGVVILDYLDVGADPTGTASIEAASAVSTHNGSASAHSSLFGDKEDKIKVVSVSLPTVSWTESNGVWSQTVNITGVTANTYIVFQPTTAQAQQFKSDGVTGLSIKNDNGTVTVYLEDNKLSLDMTIQATLTEVSA